MTDQTEPTHVHRLTRDLAVDLEGIVFYGYNIETEMIQVRFKDGPTLTLDKQHPDNMEILACHMNRMDGTHNAQPDSSFRDNCPACWSPHKEPQP